MDPQVVLVLTWVVAGLVVAAYVWFMVWRVRVDRRKKQAKAIEDSAMSDTIAKTVERLERLERGAAVTEPPPPLPTRRRPSSASTDTLSAAPTPASAPSAAPAATGATPAAHPGSAGATVADRLAGISLPHDLVPLTTMAARSATGDRVAFWTDRAPVEVVGPAFADELERLSYDITTLDAQSLAAKRGTDHLMVVIHPDGPAAIVEGRVAFSSVPERAVVIEVWVPGIAGSG